MQYTDTWSTVQGLSLGTGGRMHMLHDIVDTGVVLEERERDARPWECLRRLKERGVLP